MWSWPTTCMQQSRSQLCPGGAIHSLHDTALIPVIDVWALPSRWQGLVHGRYCKG